MERAREAQGYPKEFRAPVCVLLRQELIDRVSVLIHRLVCSDTERIHGGGFGSAAAFGSGGCGGRVGFRLLCRCGSAAASAVALSCSGCGASASAALLPVVQPRRRRPPDQHHRSCRSEVAASATAGERISSPQRRSSGRCRIGFRAAAAAAAAHRLRLRCRCGTASAASSAWQSPRRHSHHVGGDFSNTGVRQALASACAKRGRIQGTKL
jgi:hypothetical protein